MMLMMMMSMRLLNRVQLTKKTLILNLSLVTHIATNHFYNIYEYIFNVVYKFVDTYQTKSVEIKCAEYDET